MRDEDYFNIMSYGKPMGTINVVPHPKDIIDVDPFVIANMKARLNGESLSNVYDQTDRSFDEFALQREKNKLKKVFGSTTELQEAFSSIKNLKLIQDELSFENVNKELLFKYSFSASNEKNVDEYDFYQSFLFGEKLVFKNDRVDRIDIEDKFFILIDDYLYFHFEPIKITKEAIQMSSGLLSLFKERKLASQFDEFLRAFYRVKV